MIELISMIKSVQTQLLSLEACYSEAIRRSIYRELQIMVVGQLSGSLMKAQKKKERITLVRLIHAIQATCADNVCFRKFFWIDFSFCIKNQNFYKSHNRSGCIFLLVLGFIVNMT